ncbi:putative CDP-alcohol phosphatidyltransferase class-I family protein C22A12.08c [Pseudocercospora fuligena]|uniref:Putative CDP-alcohol phosphatidyltransferase class-I family protein C22A12.08c n=1 Tax=Pseudocercospora fuligena TaxID=685502 RepID=A0A8H6RPD6_9PEZI|nr:putative CDP-alcohol phosphatidyltransferase class-I family protein C22A12.08c [Pseudocercospora fuligena]
MSASSPVARPSRPSRTLRRVSSNEITLSTLNLRSPTVVVPPKHLMAPSDAHETAAAMEMARHELEDATSPLSSPSTPPVTSVTDKFAYAFDIDGVLIRGGRPIPEAIEAMKVLNGQNEWGIKVPYIFVTNGGGKSEQERCVQLSKQLDIEVSPGQFICGHTPMREMAEKYKTVLVVGGEGEKCRQVAESYGFKDVVTPGDIIKDNPDTTPFRKLTEDELKNSKSRNFAETKIEAIFVFADSRDWAGDQQIILDLLMSKGGYLGTRSETFDEGPPVFFSHNDVVWSASHDLTRLGMGALRLSLEAMFKAVTGKELNTTAFGKPQIGTFQFATRLLQQWRRDTHGIDAPPETVYFVGDTPESDIRGTNEFNKQSENLWYSILVKTGVYQPGTKPKFEPKATVENVLEAVLHGIEREQTREQKRAFKDALNVTEDKLKGTALDSRPGSPLDEKKNQLESLDAVA